MVHLNNETMALMPNGYLITCDVDTYDECCEMLNHSLNDDTEAMISDADIGLQTAVWS